MDDSKDQQPPAWKAIQRNYEQSALNWIDQHRDQVMDLKGRERLDFVMYHTNIYGLKGWKCNCDGAHIENVWEHHQFYAKLMEKTFPGVLVASYEDSTTIDLVNAYTTLSWSDIK